MIAPFKSEKIAPIGYIIPILLFIFFSLKSWFSTRDYFPDLGVFPRQIFYLLGVSIPSVLFLLHRIFIKKERLTNSSFDILFIAFLLWATVSCSYAINPASALEGVFFWYMLFGVYHCFKYLFTQHQVLTNQVLRWVIPLLGFYFIGNYLYSNRIALMDLVDSNKRYQPIVRHLRSLLGTKNVTAMFLFMVFVLHSSLFTKNNNYKIFHYIFQFTTLFTIILIGSRNTYIAVAVFFLFSFLLNIKELPRIYLHRLGLLLVVLGLFLLLVDSQKFIAHLSYNTIDSRARMWENSYSLIKETPLLGIGIFQFDMIKPLFKLDYHGHPHNDHVRTVLEMGFIGFGLYTAMWVGQVLKGIKLRRTLSLNTDYTLLSTLLAALIAYQSLSMFDGIHYKLPHLVLLMIIWAKLDVLLVSLSASAAIEDSKLSIFNGAVKWVPLGLLLGVFAYSGLFLQNQKKQKLGLLSIKQKQYEQGIQAFRAINTNIYYAPKTPIKTQIGSIKQQQKRYGEAIDYYRQSLLNYPYHKQTLESIAQCYTANKEPEKGLKYLELLHRIDKYNKSYLTQLETIYQTTGNEIGLESLKKQRQRSMDAKAWKQIKNKRANKK